MEILYTNVSVVLVDAKNWTVEYMYREDAASNIYIIFRNTKIGSTIVSLMGTHHGVKVGPNITSGSTNIGDNRKWIDFVPEPPKPLRVSIDMWGWLCLEFALLLPHRFAVEARLG
jgi:hypothetical protein